MNLGTPAALPVASATSPAFANHRWWTHRLPSSRILDQPNNPALVGFRFYVQAAGFGGGILLHCAWECMIT